MRDIHTLLIITCVFFTSLSSCKRSVVAESKYYHFDTTLTLVKEPIRINEIIQPVSFVLMPDYIVVVNSPSNGNDIFNVYSRDEFKFLYSFGMHGRGPWEYIAFTLPEHTTDNILPVLNSASNQLDRYRLSDQKESRLSTKGLKLKAGGLPQKIALINDSVFIFNTLWQNGVKTYSFNITSNAYVDTLDFVSPHRGKYGNYLESYIFDYKDGLFVAAFEYFDEIHKIRVSEDGSFHPKKIHLKNYPSLKGPEAKKSSNISYYSYPYISDDYIYVERIGRPMKELQPLYPGRNFRFDIDVFDFDLNPVAKLKFNDNIIRFIVDEEKHTLYSWDIMDNFDYVDSYRFDIPRE